MSMIDAMRGRNSKNSSSGEPKNTLPRAPTMAQPAPAPAPYYDEEVLRVAQRDYDNKRLITHLEGERDEWRRKAIAAQDECRRLEARLAELTEDRERRLDELTARRDEYRLALARFETKVGVQGKAVLDLANSISKTIIETMTDLKAEKGETDIAGSVGLAAIADAIEDEPLPRVVTAGPANE